MRRGTTTTHTITPGIDLSETKVYLTYMQGSNTVLERVTGDEGFTVTAETITNVISQAESLLFAPNSLVRVQLRWVDKRGETGASNVFNFNVEDILKPGEIYFTDPSITVFAGSTEGNQIADGDTLTIPLNGASRYVYATNPVDSPIHWESSNPEVATSADWTEYPIVISGLSLGTTTITASLVDYPDVSISFNIEVVSGGNAPS